MYIILLIAFVFNLALGISYVVIPLYAYSLGFSSTAIGSLFSLPIILQMLTRFIGGPLTDRFGEKKLLNIALSLIVLSGICFYFADSYILLLTAQLILVTARGLYWPIVQSLVSHVSQKTNIMMGRLNAVNNVGQVGGTIVAGIMIAIFGFGIVFQIFVCLGLIALVCSIKLKLKGRERDHMSAGGFSAFRDMFLLFYSPVMIVAILFSFLGAQAYILSQSFYPIYLEQNNYSSDKIGLMVAARSMGGIIAGLLLAKYLKPMQNTWLTALCACGIALSIIITPIFPDMLIIGLSLLALGIGSEGMAINYQIVASEGSDVQHRASALVVGGFGWSIAHLITPTSFGYIADKFSLDKAFMIWGSFLMIYSLSTLLVHKKVLKQNREGLKEES